MKFWLVGPAAAILLAGPAFAQLPSTQDRPLSMVAGRELAAGYERLKLTYNVTDRQLQRFRTNAIRLFGPLPDRELIAKLELSARELPGLRNRVAVLERENAELKIPSDRLRAEELTKDIRNAVADGDLDTARVKIAALVKIRQAAAERATLESGQALAFSGDIEATALRYRDASDFYLQASDALSAGKLAERWSYALVAAGHLAKQGEVFAQMQALVEAEALYRTRVLPLARQETRAADWAATQNNLGNVLGILGERAGGPEGIGYLSAARAAYARALEVYTQKDAPADWAMTQNNLGNVLRTLGERAGGPEGIGYLRAARAAYARALEVYTQTDAPAQWAMTQNNLGNVLQTLGERAGGPEGIGYLNAARAAYARALEVNTQKDAPADWARSSLNLAVAEHLLSERSGEADPVRRAIGRVDSVAAAGQIAPSQAEAVKTLREAMAALLSRLEKAGAER